jgi:hypothetical protein
MTSPDPLVVALNRLTTAVDRLAHAAEAILRMELAAEYRRQQEGAEDA